MATADMEQVVKYELEQNLASNGAREATNVSEMGQQSAVCVRIVALYEAKGRPCRNSASFRKRVKYKRPTCDNNLEAEEPDWPRSPFEHDRTGGATPARGNQWATSGPLCSTSEPSFIWERSLPDRALSHCGREGGRHFVPPRETERKTGRGSQAIGAADKGECGPGATGKAIRSIFQRMKEAKCVN